jgi:hypothetical protein
VFFLASLPELVFCLQVRPSGAYPRVEYMKSSSLQGRLLALPSNIRLGWKGLQGTNTRSLLRTFVNYGLKKFYNIEPCLQELIVDFLQCPNIFVPPSILYVCLFHIENFFILTFILFDLNWIFVFDQNL